MSYTDAVSRIGAIQDQIASLHTAFAPPATTAASSAGATSAASASLTPTMLSGGQSATPTFSSALASAMGTSPAATPTTLTAPTTLTSLPTAATGATGGAALPGRAASLLTSDQRSFASRLASDTGLDPGVVSAWLLAEESGGAATSRQGQGNNDWLNIGYTDSATYGSSDSIWSDPVSAADATAGWLKGQDTIPGYGTASSGVQGILATAGQPPSAQIAALQGSGWASSGYPQLASLYQQVAG